MNYRNLIKEIRDIVDDAMSNMQADSNLTTTHSYWEIGKRLVVNEQQGENRAAYGQEVLGQLSEELNKRYGRGFGIANLRYMRQFYQVYKKPEIDANLRWSHYRLLVQVENKKQRRKFEKQITKAGWSKRELAEQIRLLKGDETIEATGYLQRPTGRTGLLQVRRIVENEKELSFLDLGFGYWVDARPEEVEGLENKLIVELSQDRNNSRVAVYSGSSRDRYLYRATLEHVVDGDTIVVYIDLGLGARSRQILRLRGVNARSLTEPEGVKARLGLEQMMNSVDVFFIKTRKRDKYARYVADVVLPRKAQSEVDALQKGLYVNQELIDLGLAELA